MSMPPPPPVDLVCGGFPCQDLSIAGKRAGIDGARSGLWSEFARVVRVLRPRFVVVENVPELLAYLGRVLGPLAALGYDAVWDVFSAAEVGAPHLRERLFILAYADGDRIGDAVKPFGLTERAAERSRGGQPSESGTGAREWRGEGARPGPARPRGCKVPHADGVRLAGGLAGGLAADSGEAMGHAEGERRDAAGRDTWQDGRPPTADDAGRWWAAEPDVGRVVDGTGTRLDARRRRARLRGLGNGVVPQQAALAFVTLAARAGLIGGAGG